MQKDTFKDVQLKQNYDYLAPDGSEIRLLAEVNVGGFSHCTLPPGGVSKAIKHKRVEEIWYFLSGHGQVWRKLDDHEEVKNVVLGLSLIIPTGAHFQFRNSGDEPLKFIIATIPR